jgi:thiol-disulfide isomerase/thioredoxin
MKHLPVIASLLLIVFFSSCSHRNRIIEQPALIANSSPMEIVQVEINDTATVLHIHAYYAPHQWIRISPESFLIDNKGNHYVIQSSEGIPLDEEFFMPDSGEAEFKLLFPSLPASVSSIDFSEGDFDGAFKIWGIQLKGKKASAPKGVKSAKIDKNAVLLPPAFKKGTAKIEGKILDYQKGMPDELTVRIEYPVEYPPQATAIKINDDGTFSGEAPAYSTHPAIANLFGKSIRFYIAPDETTSLTVNLMEISRMRSHLRANEKPGGEPVYYGGYLASLSQELAGIESQFKVDEDFYSLVEKVYNKTVAEVKDYFLDEYKQKKQQIDTLDISPACKQLLSGEIELYYALQISNASSWVDRAYIHKNNLREMEEAKKYYATRKLDIPADLYTVLKDFRLINDPQILYNFQTAYCVYEWQIRHFESELAGALGTDKGILFDLMKAAGVYAGIKNFVPANEEQIAGLITPYKEFIQDKNDELLKTIEANKQETGFTINELDKVSNEALFPAIISKFKGKVILVDIWATWCGPCIAANKAMKPVKEELKGKEVVFVYVAGENSPLATWENMIPAMKGEHVRLTAAQWNYIGKQFHIEGVPTYLFVDRQGNIKQKQTGFSGADNFRKILSQLLDEK